MGDGLLRAKMMSSGKPLFTRACTRPIHDQNVLRRTKEKTARQQGGLFFRENSSNGGKAIRTFWRNTMVVRMECQGNFRGVLTDY